MVIRIIPTCSSDGDVITSSSVVMKEGWACEDVEGWWGDARVDGDGACEGVGV